MLLSRRGTLNKCFKIAVHIIYAKLIHITFLPLKMFYMLTTVAACSEIPIFNSVFWNFGQE